MTDEASAMLGCDSWGAIFQRSSGPVIFLKRSMSLAVPMPVIIEHYEDGYHIEYEPCDHNVQQHIPLAEFFPLAARRLRNAMPFRYRHTHGNG